ncbi:MAG: hypothetical protein WBA67_17955 [Jannaschia sp.]
MARPGRRLLWVWLPCALVAAFVLPLREGAVTVAGDGAPAVMAVMAEDATSAAMSVDAVLLRRPENLRHLPDVGLLCRGRCDAGMTVLYEVRPGGGRKVLVFDLSTFDGVDALDRGEALPDDIAACVAEAIDNEANAVLGAPETPCLASRRFRVVLPYGL